MADNFYIAFAWLITLTPTASKARKAQGTHE